MYLFHGTSASRAERSLVEGIRPRSETGLSNWENNPSCAKAVYLTNAYPIFFANVAASENDEDEAAYLVIDTDRLDHELMAADEDAVEQALRHAEYDALADHTMQERTEILRDMLLQLRHQGFTWGWSLTALGNCTYHGVIPPEAIIKTVRWSTQSPMSTCCDPAMALINYMIMGGYYRRMSAVLADLPFNEAEDAYTKTFDRGQLDALKALVNVTTHRESVS